MSAFIVAVIINVFLLQQQYIQCNEPKNLEERQDTENWMDITGAICKSDQPMDVKQAMQQCYKLDPYYEYDSLTKKCDKLRASPGADFYDETRGDCQYQQCYVDVTKSKDFKRLAKYVESLSDETRLLKEHEKYVCIRKALKLIV